jgi:hypothetical protein
MDVCGTISKAPDPPGVDIDDWVRVARSHPDLCSVEPVVGLNPFTKESMTYRPHPGDVWIVVDGSPVGIMSWAEYGANEIVVCGEGYHVDAIASRVAELLGASYRPWAPDVDGT